MLMCLFEAVLEALLVLPTDVDVTNAEKKDFHYCSKVWDLFLFILFFFQCIEALLCSPRLHLFDQKYSKTVILWNIIAI